MYTQALRTSNFIRELAGTTLKGCRASTYMSPAASASVPAGSVLVQSCADGGRMKRKKDCIETWRRYSPLCYKCGGDRGHKGAWAVPQGSTYRYWLFGSASHIKTDAPFFCPQTLNMVFCNLKGESSLNWPKNIGDCGQSRDRLNKTSVSPPFFWLYNTFKG